MAVLAKESGDYPFASVLVDSSGKIILEKINSQIIDNDITAHSKLKLVKKSARLYDQNLKKLYNV